MIEKLLINDKKNIKIMINDKIYFSESFLKFIY